MKNIAVTATESAFLKAATKGDLALIAELTTQVGPDCLKQALRLAAKHGHLSIVQYFYHHKPGMSFAFSTKLALDAKHIDIVQWLCDQDPQLCTIALHAAIDNADFCMMDYLFQKITKPNTKVVAKHAFLSGKIEVVKYLHQHQGLNLFANSKYLSKKNYLLAIKKSKDNIEILEYLNANGLVQRLSSREIIVAAISSRNVEVVKFFEKETKYFQNDVAFAWKFATSSGRFEIVRYLHTRFGINIHDAHDATLRLAAKNGHLDIVRYLYENGVDISDIPEQDIHAKIKQYYQMKNWLRTEVSELQKLAAKVYLQYYQTLPEANIVPCKILAILTSIQL